MLRNQGIKMKEKILNKLKIIKNKIINKLKKLKSKVINRLRKYKKIIKDKIIEKHKVLIIVSLTSYPPRIENVNQVINSLLEQTMLPDKIILWLAKEQFKNKEKDLPQALIELKKKGLTIKWCDDIKSHKKYYYTMKKYPNDIIITVDDDMIYEKTLIEDLYKGYKKFPKAISCTQAREISLSEPYINWKRMARQEIDKPMMDLLAIGCGGILYPPRILPQETFDKKDIFELSLATDDLWLKTMEILNKVPTFFICNPKYLQNHYIEGSQEIGLRKINLWRYWK